MRMATSKEHLQSVMKSQESFSQVPSRDHGPLYSRMCAESNSTNFRQAHASDKQVACSPFPESNALFILLLSVQKKLNCGDKMFTLA